MNEFTIQLSSFRGKETLDFYRYEAIFTRTEQKTVEVRVKRSDGLSTLSFSLNKQQVYFLTKHIFDVKDAYDMDVPSYNIVDDEVQVDAVDKVYVHVRRLRVELQFATMFRITIVRTDDPNDDVGYIGALVTSNTEELFSFMNDCVFGNESMMIPTNVNMLLNENTHIPGKLYTAPNHKAVLKYEGFQLVVKVFNEKNVLLEAINNDTQERRSCVIPIENTGTIAMYVDGYVVTLFGKDDSRIEMLIMTNAKGEAVDVITGDPE